MKLPHALLPLLALGAAMAGCATAQPPLGDQPRDGRATLALGDNARFGRLDVVPLRIEEDSRCPTGVQCIQAGTVRLAVRIEDRGRRSESILTLEEPLELPGGGWLVLAGVCPYPHHPQAILRASYRFTLAFGLQAPPAPLDIACPR